MSCFDQLVWSIALVELAHEFEIFDDACASILCRPRDMIPGA